MRLALFLITGLLQAQSFVAAYVSALPQSSPKPTIGGAFCTQTKLASGTIWSCTGDDLLIVNRKATFSAWSGAAIPLMTPWNTRVFLLAAPGGATTTATTTVSGVSLNGGMLIEIPPPTKRWWAIFVPRLVGPAVIKSNITGSQVFFRLAFGTQLQ